ncbi:MAG: 50S ribosomal protein L22 [Candidatus Yonathbacteria bacterium CG10_big_fil_rev_8_21_14_0_10_43_136]|uniref:Large ribosomal subunit protein uL22 n=2 Tax=Parcubacteria group TaxID=1794811 RepID=A0A2M7Q4V6_9BACT|nr:MAG: 50S ribosomal protein L22 [Candidatus Nomurabacteria bacterium CG2_30_43_9]PIQ36091.1 MAG: 50S ribosomal protein L22 [Candidatus Yonathbacteria bacterium CG17_big_fil_post_rev_8_21_14_2_50_43_9]PIR40441.1 MAG: 50S ribosomal protein L22 [Candidatus Yonathbacteria bacterium CG10_big_fil_rev_8_21_14_0_10_43_136]PIX56906.1 MAG: 50S ribosomal protein L22 [Candidatus Yonathbacteria bacterium CG_4_10_14_3_um_filter_43_12]PIY58122.1 MAG: 50S ribosomal protein L22 [Candidatus Yonathbacteria bact
MKAILKSYRQAPRKVRLVANLIKGKTAPRALAQLDVLPKRASGVMKKLLMSAIANAKENDGIALEDLFVKEVRVDQGTILKRSMPKSHGSAHPIHKHTSHIMIELIASADVAPSKRATKKEAIVEGEPKKVSKKVALANVKASAKPKGTSIKTKN